MSLYNMLYEYNKDSVVLLVGLEISPDLIPRFRDAYLTKDRVVIFTKSGGGNREMYQEQIDVLRQHPLYERDEDEPFDPVYMNFYFRIPSKLQRLIDDGRLVAADSTPMERMQNTIETLRRGDTSNPEYQKAVEVGMRVLGPIFGSL